MCIHPQTENFLLLLAAELATLAVCEELHAVDQSAVRKPSGFDASELPGLVHDHVDLTAVKPALLVPPSRFELIQLGVHSTEIDVEVHAGDHDSAAIRIPKDGNSQRVMMRTNVPVHESFRFEVVLHVDQAGWKLIQPALEPELHERKILILGLLAAVANCFLLVGPPGHLAQNDVG